MFKNYLKTAWRSLLKNKTSSLINISGLAVGLATGIIIMLLIVNEFSYDKFNTNLKDIYLLMKNQKQVDGISTGDATAGPMAASLRSEMPETKYAARVAYFDNQLMEIGDKTIYESGIYAEPAIFNMMTLPAIEGNPVTALQNENSVVITEQTARKLFGKEDPMGKLVLTNKSSFKVAAVVRDVPPNSTIKFDMVFSFSYFAKQNTWLSKWDDNRIQTWVQLKPGANLSLLDKKLTHILEVRSNDTTVSLFVYPFAKLRLYRSFSNGRPNGGRIDMVILLMVLAVFVILIACINFMNISTARSEHRSREVGIRKVLGASRKLIIYQFMSEAMLMTFLALLLAVFLAQMVLPVFNRYTGNNLVLNFWNWKVLALLIAIGLFTGLIAGSYPALFLSRFKIIKVLKGALANGKSGSGLRKALVTIQFIISIFLIIATIVIYKQINHVGNRPLGYDQDNLIDIAANGDLSGNFQILKNDLVQIPGVKNITAGSDNILQFGGSVTGMDYPGKIPGQEISVIVSSVQYDWAKTVGIKMLEGRDFSPDFATDSTACIINESTVQKMGLKEPIVGQNIGGKSVIGVFQNFVYNNPSGIIAPMVISLQTGNLPHFFVRIKNDDHWRSTLAQIEAAVKKINHNYPFEYSFTKADYQRRFEEWSSVGFAATIFGSMAIFIACLGLFGLSSFLAEKRGKEISIRKVFGASVKSIWLLLSKDFLKPVFIAMVIVIPISVWLAHVFLSGITYHTELTWWMFTLAGLITVLVALITVSFQGIKAAIANPVKNLRSE
ncbi:MAG: ABC transporter permease [Bacteroidota bacterium]|nr:ABC transporter permease [Bacteroidota bacterium]